MGKLTRELKGAHEVVSQVTSLIKTTIDRSAGLTVPLADLLIFACAKLNGLVAHDDSQVDELAKLDA